MSIEVIQAHPTLSIRVCPWEMKMFIGNVLKVIDPVEADFLATILLGHHLVALEGVYGRNLLST